MSPPNLLHLINEQIQQLDFSWQQFFHSIALEPWWQQLLTKLITAYQRQKVTPPITKLFRALTFFPLPKTKVVILGQDPYHTPNVANGLAFVAWGQKAQRIISNLPLANNQCWQASHPSGFSAHISFFTIPVFKPINQLLSDWKKQPINWLAGAQFY